MSPSADGRRGPAGNREVEGSPVASATRREGRAAGSRASELSPAGCGYPRGGARRARGSLGARRRSGRRGVAEGGGGGSRRRPLSCSLRPTGGATRRRSAPVLVGCALVALLLAACDLSPTARVTTRPPAATPEAPVWTGTTAARVSSGGTGALVVVPDPSSIGRGLANGNLRPLWLLYRVDASGVVDLTPIGETTRGGLVVAVGAGRAIWVGVGSYRYQLDGTVAETSDGGRHWHDAVLPALLDPRPGALFAWNAEDAVAIVEPLGTTAASRRGLEDQELVVTGDGGARWTTILSARAAGRLLPASCALSGLGSTTAGQLWVGTRCRAGRGRLLDGVSVGGRWRWRVEVVAAGPVGGAPPGGAVTVAPPGTLVSGSSSRGGSFLADLGVVTTTSTDGSAVALYRSRGGTVVVSGPVLETTSQRAPVLAAGSGGVAALVGAGGSAPVVRWLVSGSSAWSRPQPVVGGRPSAFALSGAGQLWFAGVRGGRPAAWTAETAVPPSGPIVLRAVDLPLPETSAQLPGAGS